MAVTRCYVKVRNLKDPKEELTVALSRLKKKIKESGIFVEYLEHQSYRRPAVRIKEKRMKARSRRRAEIRRNEQNRVGQ